MWGLNCRLVWVGYPWRVCLGCHIALVEYLKVPITLTHSHNVFPMRSYQYDLASVARHWGSPRASPAGASIWLFNRFGSVCEECLDRWSATSYRWGCTLTMGLSKQNTQGLRGPHGPAAPWLSGPWQLIFDG